MSKKEKKKKEPGQVRDQKTASSERVFAQEKAGMDSQQAAGKGELTEEGEADKADEIAVYRERLKALEKELEESRDKFLRLFSEFDNYRKRVSKERLELSKTAAEGMITALLPVLDDLERAHRMRDGQQGLEDEGIGLIYNKFKGILRQKGVEEIPAEGTGFDTDYHEAITHVPARDEGQKGKVVEEVQKGYLLNGKVIRFARVVVAN